MSNREHLATGIRNRESVNRARNEFGNDSWIFKLLREGTLPHLFQIHDMLRSWNMTISTVRDMYISAFGFPLITEEVVIEVSEYLRGRKILEVAAGSGYLASLLQARGIDIKCTDNCTWANAKNSKNYHGWKDSFMEIEEIDALKAIEKYAEDGYDTILLSWPPFNKPLAYNVLKSCIEHNLKLIYIGEWVNGLNGDLDFFQLIDEQCEDKRISFSYIPFTGIHDGIFEITKKG